MHDIGAFEEHMVAKCLLPTVPHRIIRGPRHYVEINETLIVVI